MKPDDLIRIRHMIEASRTIARFVDGRRRAELEDDTMLGFAIVRAIEIFGEAASGIARDPGPGAWDSVGPDHRHA